MAHGMWWSGDERNDGGEEVKNAGGLWWVVVVPSWGTRGGFVAGGVRTDSSDCVCLFFGVFLVSQGCDGVMEDGRRLRRVTVDVVVEALALPAPSQG